MGPSDAVNILIIIILLILSAYFSSAETALTTVNKIRMRSLAEENSKAAKRVLKLIEEPSKMLSAVLICNNIVNLSASSISTSYAFSICKRIGMENSTSLFAGIATGILTVLILIFGEITPKNLATKNAEKLALFYSSSISAITHILTPVIFIVNQFARFLMFLLRVDTSKKSSSITEDELRTFVDVSHEEGVIESEERKMITNIVDFGDTLAKDVTDNMEKYELGIAVQKVHDFIWDEFCDWYVEIAKYRIYHAEEDSQSANCALWVLKTVLGQALKLLHPFMPFITEEIYGALVPEEESLMMSSWPVYREDWEFPYATEVIEHVKAITRGIRNMRAEMNVPNNKRTKVYIISSDSKLLTALEVFKESVKSLMLANDIILHYEKKDVADDAVSIVVPGATVYLPLEDLVDFEQERERLKKEEERLNSEIKRAQGMLANERFTSKAPADKVQAERDKLEKYTKMLEQVKERIDSLR